MEETPRRVLVVVPHPDDAEIWCGGTIARWVRRGASVHYVLCTDGSKGTADRQVTSRELAAVREKEQQEAARVLGVSQVVMLHHPDGELDDTRDFRKEIVRQVRLVRPDIVICPEPYRRNLPWHRDHRIVGQVTVDAVFPCARDHLHFVELWAQEGLEPHKTGTVLFWGTEMPDTHIDITDTIGVKIKAVMAHRSQMAGRGPAEVEGFVKERAQAAAVEQEFPYAEAFRKISFNT